MSDLSAQSSRLMDWLMSSALPLWWGEGADHVHGGFHEALDLHGQPVSANRRARVQTRQIYVYAAAGELGWDGPWRAAVAHGLDFFLDKYRRDDGLYRTTVAPDGSVVDNGAWLYDQAFALFAMAQAARVLPERSLREKAHELRQTLDDWRMSEGGFREPNAKWAHQSNPHMHLLEASLAWAEVDDDPAWIALADEIADLAITRFVDKGGALHEFFVEDWKAAPGVDGRIVEPGHQFEWGWLLERWSKQRDSRSGHEVAESLFRIGAKSASCDKRGVATQQLLDDGSVHDDVARLWPQTERMKAALIFNDKGETGRAIQGLELYLDTPVRGLWRDKLRSDGSFVTEPAPASSFYHIVCAIAELAASVRTGD